MRKVLIALILGCVVLTGACSRRNKVQNPLANLDSKQPDKVLFDRAMDALQRKQYDVSRLTFQTLINTYPDSEYIARAKLGVADSWFAEGNTAAMAQAESEYKDFITFFPNMPEAAEAQLKVAGIHYRQMLKPDRDYTHAKRAEDEYRQMIQQFPDSKLVPEAKQRLREVQEVLAEREFRIGRFYFLRESYAAAVARLKTLADQYPLYSNADQALWMLAQSYERQSQALKQVNADSRYKEKLQGELQKRAAAAYSRIITRYPVSAAAADAKARLQALSFPVPKPTPEAIAQNKAEIESRSDLGMMGKAWDNFRSRPNLTSAAKVGEPSLEDQEMTSAPAVVRELGHAMVSDTGKSNATVEQVKPGDVKPNEAAPRSDAGTSDSGKANTENEKPESASENSGAATPYNAKSNSANSGTAKSDDAKASEQPTDNATEPAATKSSEQTGGDLSGQPAGDQSGISTLQVTKPSDPNLQPEQVDKPVQPAQAPGQVNDARTSDSSSKAGATQQDGTNSSDDQKSSSKKKKKKKFGIF